MIFPNPELLAKQESIVYPIIIEETKKIISQNKGKNIILNATVLYKTPELLNLCEKIIFVTAPLAVRFIRARKRDKMPFRQIIQRFKSQKNLLKKYQETGIPVEILINIKKQKKI
ncbi:MAG: dephospho-CoA kinase [Treponema sp.]|nr:dephospho-CoA kinase [Treponema sp.]